MTVSLRSRRLLAVLAPPSRARHPALRRAAPWALSLALAATGLPTAAQAQSAAPAPHARPAARTAPARDRFAVAGTSEAEIRPFLAALQAAVAADDRRAVTRMFFFPSKVWDGHQSVAVVRRRELTEHYDGVFDAALKQAIAQARVDTLFANWQGVSLGDGRLWFARITTQSRLAVTAVNPPPGKPNG